MTAMDIAIVGGGLAGLTCALELISASPRLRIVVYEKQKECGGFAKSKGRGLSFQEHSFRTFGAGYTNTKDVLRRVGVEWPAENRRIDTPASLIRRSPPGLAAATPLSIMWLMLGLLLPYALQRRVCWYAMNHEADSLLTRFNKAGSQFDTIPWCTMTQFTELTLRHGPGLYISRKPISDYLIDPLVRYLGTRGVLIRTGQDITNLDPEALGARVVVCATPPSAPCLQVSTTIYPWVGPYMHRFALETQHQEISFRVWLPVAGPLSKRVWDLHDTPWGLLVMDATAFYEGEWPEGQVCLNGTCTAMASPDDEGVTPGQCSLARFEESVMRQLTVAGVLSEVRATGRPTRFQVWDAWREDPATGLLVSDEVMHVNSCKETQPRLPAGTRIGPATYVCGAHTLTSTEIWLMEAAIESGKLCARVVLAEYSLGNPKLVRVHEHSRSVLQALVVLVALGMLLRALKQSAS